MDPYQWCIDQMLPITDNCNINEKILKKLWNILKSENCVSILKIMTCGKQKPKP